MKINFANIEKNHLLNHFWISGRASLLRPLIHRRFTRWFESLSESLFKDRYFEWTWIWTRTRTRTRTRMWYYKIQLRYTCFNIHFWKVSVFCPPFIHSLATISSSLTAVLQQQNIHVVLNFSNICFLNVD